MGGGWKRVGKGGEDWVERRGERRGGKERRKLEDGWGLEESRRGLGGEEGGEERRKGKEGVRGWVGVGRRGGEGGEEGGGMGGEEGREERMGGGWKRVGKGGEDRVERRGRGGWRGGKGGAVNGGNCMQQSPTRRTRIKNGSTSPQALFSFH